MIPNEAAYLLRRLLVGHDVNGELDAMPEPWKGMAAHLAGLGTKTCPTAWKAMLAARPEREELVKVLEAIDPLSPAPPAATGAPFATLADVAKIVSAQSWLWKGWLAIGVLNAVAADPGVGKTRFALDLARRLWFGLPWPDGQAATLPAGTRTLWVQGDRNFAEMLQLSRDFDLPDEAVALSSCPDEPFSSLDLDDPATLAAVGDRIQAAGAFLAIIDTVGMTTSRNLSRPDEAREFFAPILELCQKTGLALLWSDPSVGEQGGPRATDLGEGPGGRQDDPARSGRPSRPPPPLGGQDRRGQATRRRFRSPPDPRSQIRRLCQPDSHGSEAYVSALGSSTRASLPVCIRRFKQWQTKTQIDREKLKHGKNGCRGRSADSPT
jgi:hypothetical protein